MMFVYHYVIIPFHPQYLPRHTPLILQGGGCQRGGCQRGGGRWHRTPKFSLLLLTLSNMQSLILQQGKVSEVLPKGEGYMDKIMSYITYTIILNKLFLIKHIQNNVWKVPFKLIYEKYLLAKRDFQEFVPTSTKIIIIVILSNQPGQR